MPAQRSGNENNCVEPILIYFRASSILASISQKYTHSQKLRIQCQVDSQRNIAIPSINLLASIIIKRFNNILRLRRIIQRIYNFRKVTNVQSFDQI